MIDLPEVTLVVYNPVHGSEVSARVLNHCLTFLRPAAAIHLTDKPPTIPCAAQFVQVPKNGWKIGQRVQALELGKYFTTKWMLHMETDGYPMHPDMWSPDFLNYDYIGAPWRPPPYSKNNRVGNGGCSLQSRAFREKIEAMGSRYRGQPSDMWFCQDLYKEVVAAGITYAPIDVAIRFSFELPVPEHPGWNPRNSFAFHGRYDHFREYLKIANPS